MTCCPRRAYFTVLQTQCYSTPATSYNGRTLHKGFTRLNNGQGFLTRIHTVKTYLKYFLLLTLVGLCLLPLRTRLTYANDFQLVFSEKHNRAYLLVQTRTQESQGPLAYLFWVRLMESNWLRASPDSVRNTEVWQVREGVVKRIPFPVQRLSSEFGRSVFVKGGLYYLDIEAVYKLNGSLLQELPLQEKNRIRAAYNQQGSRRLEAGGWNESRSLDEVPFYVKSKVRFRSKRFRLQDGVYTIDSKNSFEKGNKWTKLDIVLPSGETKPIFFHRFRQKIELVLSPLPNRR